MLKKTPLNSQHKNLGARMVPFAGWEMPVSYKGIIEEHNAVRNSVGIFDIGHMGLIKIEGEAALPLIQKTATNDAAKLAMNESQYSILCNESGGTVDDILVYRLPMVYLVVCNASNTEKVLAWLRKQINGLKHVSVSLYENYCMLSIQGPKAAGFVEKSLNVELSGLKRNHALWWRDIIVSRTGYTGEDGIELIVAKSEVPKIWQALIAAGVQPCGLGARDTLRLEAGYPLYGHEYDDKTSPLEAGYGWAVKFDKGSFVGQRALLAEKEAGLKKKLVGLEIDGRAIARAGDS
ncbi:MAG: glycine cleavage system aminomethyltransferase GcvT, partial [Candidatus Margulisbacteria bacterium]|nr:glycine cleavage system aminomethyltransferase GcvT [Candidatus Margulisiibacteriota bacterium]